MAEEDKSLEEFLHDLLEQEKKRHEDARKEMKHNGE